MLVVLETPPTTYLPRHHVTCRQEPKPFSHPLLWTISHSLNQPKANIITFFLVLSHWNAKENLVVCSSSAEAGSEPSWDLWGSSRQWAVQWYHPAHWEGTKPWAVILHPSLKGTAETPTALRGLTGIFRSRLLRTQRLGEFCLPITQCSLQWDY